MTKAQKEQPPLLTVAFAMEEACVIDIFRVGRTVEVLRPRTFGKASEVLFIVVGTEIPGIPPWAGFVNRNCAAFITEMAVGVIMLLLLLLVLLVVVVTGVTGVATGGATSYFCICMMYASAEMI